MKSPFKKILTPLFIFLIILSIMSASCTTTSASSSQNTAEENKKIIKKDDKYIKGELLVKFKEGVSKEEISAINKEKETEVLEFIKGIKVYRLKIISNKSVEGMVETYSKDLRIEYAEPNYIQRTMERNYSTKEDAEKQAVWKIEFTISGGFAGIHRHLTLNSIGKLTAADKKFKKHAEKQISQEQLTEIANIIEHPGFLVNEKEASRLGGKCADCFQYRLTLSVNDKKATAIFNDLTLRDSKYTALIKLLSTMLEQALKD